MFVDISDSCSALLFLFFYGFYFAQTVHDTTTKIFARKKLSTKLAVDSRSADFVSSGLVRELVLRTRQLATLFGAQI